jgi:prolipoprotein diacylglyceryltransferase
VLALSVRPPSQIKILNSPILALRSRAGQAIGRWGNFVNQISMIPTDLMAAHIAPEQAAQGVEFETFHPLFLGECSGVLATWRSCSG